MYASTRHWVDEIVEHPRPELAADMITAARAIAGLEAEAGRPFKRRRGVPGTFDSTAGGFAVGSHDPFSDEAVDVRRVMRDGRPMTIDDVVHTYSATGEAERILRSAAANMQATAEKVRRDQRRLNLDDLIAMSQADLYVLMEQAGGAERHQRFPLAHAFGAPLEYHPYLGSGTVSLLQVAPDVRTGRENVGSDSARLRSLRGDGGLIVHPYSRRSFPMLANPVRQIDGKPTISVRTLYVPDVDLHLKTSFAGKITSGSRFLDFPAAQLGLRLSRVMRAAYERGLLGPGMHFLPELEMTTHASNPFANMLVRGGLSDIVPAVDPTDRVVALSTLTTVLPFTDGKTLLELISERHGPHVIDQVIAMQPKNHLRLFNLGLSHESHGQNTLVIFNSDFSEVKGLCIRDLEGTQVDLVRLAEFGLTLGNRPDERKRIVTRDKRGNYEMSRFFTHCVLDCGVGIAATQIVQAGLRSVSQVSRLVHSATREASTDYVKSRLEPTFYRRSGTGQSLGTGDQEFRVVEAHALMVPSRGIALPLG